MSPSKIKPGPEVIDLRSVSLIDQVEVLYTEEDSGNIAAMVPVDLVYMQDVPVDEEHVKDLAASIKKEAETKGGHGQLSPVSLAEIVEFGQFPIMDGFHRTPAVKLLGRESVYGTLRPNSSWEDVIDHRILAATTHRSVRFSRVVEWVEEAWRMTPWSRRVGSVSAFTLAHSRTSTGERLGLAPEEVKEIKNWVNKKCDFWRLSPFTIYNNLSIARAADPELVHEARERRQGRTLEALTPMHLSVVTKALPYDFEKQRLLADIAKKHAMTVPKTRAAAQIISEAKTIEEAVIIAEETDWDDVQPVLSKSRKSHDLPQQSPLEQLANVNYVVANLGETVKSIGATALKNLDGKKEVLQKSENELVKRFREIGHKCLEIAAAVEAKVHLREQPVQQEPAPKQAMPVKQDKPQVKLTPEEQAIEEFENSLINFIENGGSMPYITARRAEATRSLLKRLSTHKKLNKDQSLSDRYIEVELAVSRAEQKLEKNGSKK